MSVYSSISTPPLAGSVQLAVTAPAWADTSVSSGDAGGVAGTVNGVDGAEVSPAPPSVIASTVNVTGTSAGQVANDVESVVPVVE